MRIYVIDIHSFHILPKKINHLLDLRITTDCGASAFQYFVLTYIVFMLPQPLRGCEIIKGIVVSHP